MSRTSFGLACFATLAFFPLQRARAADSREPRAIAHFAAGCFWCAEHDFEAVPGVLSVISGYTGGGEPNPTYEQVSSGTTGHAESIEVVYNPHQVSYEKLLDVFWHNVDPVAVDAQFCDHGHQYRSAIFYSSPEEKALAEKTKSKVEAKLKEKVATEVVPSGKFWPAEEYHQHYATKNPIRYQFYRTSCGRDRRLKELRQRLDMK
jgi:peptide-methionine (S)-S-oxide reductase